MVDRTEEDQFIVLACDGIYDVMTNEDVANFVRYHMQITKNLTEICNKIVDTCLHKVRYSTSVLPYSSTCFSPKERMSRHCVDSRKL